MGALLTLVEAKRTGGRGRSKGLPDKLMGYVIECLVEAYTLLGGGGRLTSARPDSDIDHKDFIVDWRGAYKNIYLQVKGSADLHSDGMFQVCVDYRRNKVMADPRLVYVFCLLDSKAMTLTRIWLVPAPDFNRLAPKTVLPSGLIRFSFAAGKTGKWARYEIQPLTLGARLLQYMRNLEPAKTGVGALRLAS